MEWWANDLKTYEIGDINTDYVCENQVCRIVFLTDDFTEEQQDDVVRAVLNKIREIRGEGVTGIMNKATIVFRIMGYIGGCALLMLLVEVGRVSLPFVPGAVLLTVVMCSVFVSDRPQANKGKS